jgi:crossover junction endodeoxyribonuclease RuvC
VSHPESGLRILGVDPGSKITGWGLILLNGSDLKCLDHGIIRPPQRASLPERLSHLHEGMTRLLAESAPDEVAVEDLYVARNARSALTLGHARGIILLACAQLPVMIREYPANSIKQAVLGQGGSAATKERVAFMVKAILDLPEIPEPADITDALACAICHAHKRSLPQ